MVIAYKEQIQKKFEEVAQFLQNHFGIKKVPTLIYRQTGSIAGFFQRDQNILSLNPAYFEHNLQDMLNQTLPHELAHAFTHYNFRERLGKKNVAAHGREWESVMNILGVPPIKCHNYNTDIAYGKVTPVQVEAPTEFANYEIVEINNNPENW